MFQLPVQFVSVVVATVAIMVCLVMVPTIVVARDIPMKKAIPPLMDPIPTLPEITHRIYMDITIGEGGEDINEENEEGEEQTDDESNSPNQHRTGRIVIGLFGKNAPTAAENFRLLATCTNSMVVRTTGTSTSTSTTSNTHTNTQRRMATTNIPPHATDTTSAKNILCYKDTIFHRILPNFAIQGGDTTHGNGIGGRAAIQQNNKHGKDKVYPNVNDNDGTYLPYMINATQFNRPYMVAVATPNTKWAKSQFFITTVKAQWLAPLQYTIFGMVLEGRDYIHLMERIAGTYGGRPKVTVRIVDCGELPLQPYDTEPHY